MGSPISRIIAKIFLLHFQDVHIEQLLDTKKYTYNNSFIQRTCCVDDILITYDTTRTNPHTIHAHINQIYDNIKLNSTYENNVRINILEWTKIRKQTNLKIDVFRKLTTTDTTVNFLSNHHKEHKMAAFRYHISRMYSILITAEKTKRMGINTTNSQKQLSTKSSTETKPTNTKQNQPCSTELREDKKTWTTFTYYSPQIRKITKSFKHSNIDIAFRNTNTLE